MASEVLGLPITLRDYIQKCEAEPDRADWMVYEGNELILDSLLYPVLVDTSKLDPEEYLACEDRILGMGYSNCLHSDQLAEILKSLRRQKPDYTDRDLERSIDHYAEHDCFLTL